MKVCHAFLLILSVGLPLSALEIGKNYDFYQKSGQNLLGAELISEAEDRFVVKLKYVPKPITLHEGTLLRPPELSKIQPPPPAPSQQLRLTKDFVLHVSGGYTYMTFGPLSPLFKTGFQAYAGADWLFFKSPIFRIRALTALVGFSAFEQTPRRIQLISGLAGPKFLLWESDAWGAAIFASPLAGISYANLKGYTFSSDYYTFAAMAVLSFEKRFARISVGAQLYANYLFDSSLDFASTGMSLSVQYPLFDAKKF